MTMSEETKEALRKERKEITELVQHWRFPWWSPDESEAVMKEIADEIRSRDCDDLGHVRGIRTNQITGRERCLHCHAYLHLPAAQP